ncbi:MAG: bifunctional tRNA (5-methylaminomethyl-2-thiouridine)(34)-methyltransferase MnmD/FAD-dependent 5-carboxymethylaminomethyl-2-thiouridine(34) oxidoreductase MnmC [Betaproteobacteria bacterium]|nr:MAG: bifunctional tRNA (5-methylaminomethyl-2-thiouridine)(34)-methyltransferase MnmD/FAD-dependent 5-carboxymethylaminomethyl-2-thiouridine(34) oxidoreductase MnmC [Betaproteobacteria bacterium]
MKTRPIVPAHLQWTDEGVPFSDEFDDVYHPAAGALEQARHVFLAGTGLPERWQGRERFVVLETGFGLGNNFLATWDAWRRSEQRCRQLHFISIEQRPLTRDDLRAVQRDASLADLASRLADAWPPLTPNLHRLSFDDGRVELLLALGDVAAWLPELVAQVDAFYLDGFAPAKNPQMWQPRIYRAMARLAARGATAATWTAARSVRDGLVSAGFDVTRASGRGGKRDITLATYTPAFMPRRATARKHAPTASREALVVGAGLAGCAVAWALAEHGWRSVVLDRESAPAQAASGNLAGLFHGIANPQDGTHARFNRAAAIATQRVVEQAALTRGAIGSVQGLLRLETSGTDAASMRAMLAQQGLPADYVAALDAADASRSSGIPLEHPAWLYPGGGWVRPVELANWFLDRAGANATFRGGVTVHSLHRIDGRWQLLAADGATIAEAETIVLANAGDALRLLGHPSWPIRRLRGQVSMLPATVPLPRIPVTGAGYLLPEVDGMAMFGASSQPNDDDPTVRASDHAHNLAQLARLTRTAIGLASDSIQGRTGWRWSTDDRLPIVGAVPDAAAAAVPGVRLDQARFVPRLPGLFAFTALGSRGITWSALSAQALAATICGAPVPIESSLLDSIDPARFITREARREANRG